MKAGERNLPDPQRGRARHEETEEGPGIDSTCQVGVVPGSFPFWLYPPLRTFSRGLGPGVLRAEDTTLCRISGSGDSKNLLAIVAGFSAGLALTGCKGLADSDERSEKHESHE